MTGLGAGAGAGLGGHKEKQRASLANATTLHVKKAATQAGVATPPEKNIQSSRAVVQPI